MFLQTTSKIVKLAVIFRSLSVILGGGQLSVKQIIFFNKNHTIFDEIKFNTNFRQLLYKL